MTKSKTIKFRVDDSEYDFWCRTPVGRRSGEGRKWLNSWKRIEGEDSREKWQKILEEHKPFVALAEEKLKEIAEKERAALADSVAKEQQKETTLNTLRTEVFKTFGYRVENVPTNLISHYAAVTGLTTEEIIKTLSETAKKKGMVTNG